MERDDREQLLTRKSGQEVDEKERQGLFVDKKGEQEEGRGEEKDEEERIVEVEEGREGYIVE